MTKFLTHGILYCHGSKAKGGGHCKWEIPPTKSVGNKTWFCKIWFFWEVDDKFNAQMHKPHACAKRSNENTFLNFNLTGFHSINSYDIICIGNWGDLLRSVLHIKFGDKIKSHRYLDKSGWLGLIYCSNYRDHWRLLLFELETKILWLLKSVCHTVTLKFVHASGPI